MSEFLGPLLAENFLSEIANAGPEAQAAALVNLGLVGVDTTSGDIALAAETSRAEGVEATLSAAITAETARATAAEVLLTPLTAMASYLTKTSAASLYQSVLGFIPYNANNPFGYQTAAQVSTAVTTETTRASAAESTLTSNLLAETARAQTAEGLLAPRNSPIFTGVPITATASPGTSSNQVASTAFVTTAVGVETTARSAATALLAPIASPSLTGVPTAPTATLGTNNTQIATTAFVVAFGAAASGYTLPVATNSVLGGVKPDGTTVTNNSGIISVTYGTAANTAAQGNDSRITGAEQTTNKNQVSGYAGLDSGGRVAYAQLPASLAQGFSWGGTWNASTNSPALTSGTGTTGVVYVVSTAGTTTLDGLSSWGIGDKVVFNSTLGVWEKIDGQAIEVASVVGQTGAITASQISTALGLGGAAILNVGTITGTVADGGVLTTEISRATAAEALKAPISSPTFTGVPAAPTATPGASTTQIATTAFTTSAVGVEVSRATTAEALLAPKASPTFTGVPAIPTATTGTNTTQAASTAFVTTAVSALIPVSPIGDVVVVSGTAGVGGAVTPSALSVLATNSTTSRTLAARASDRYNVLDYGADPTGTADSTPAFSAAQNAAQSAGGGIVYIPAGWAGRTYKLNSTVYSVTSVIILFDPGVVLTGTGGVEALTDQLQGGVAFINADFGAGVPSTLFVSKNIGVSGATSSYEKNGIYVRVNTGDPSTGGLNLDAVGIETQAQIVTGNMYGRAWGLDTIVNVEAGADGYAVGYEIAIENYGVNQPLIDQTNSKLGLTLFASGTVNSTAALNVNTAGAKWQDGIFIKDIAVESTALRLVHNTGSAWADIWHIDVGGNELVQNLAVNGTFNVAGAATFGNTLSAGAITGGAVTLAANSGGLVEIGNPATASGTPTLQFWGNSVTSNPSVQIINDASGHLDLINSGGGGANVTMGMLASFGSIVLNGGGGCPNTTGSFNGGEGLGFTWNLTNGDAESDFVAYRESTHNGGFAWYDYIVGGSPVPIATLSSTGVLTVGSYPVLTTTAIPASDTLHLLGATGTAGVAGVIALGANLYITGGTLNATGGGGSSTSPITYTFTVTSSGQSITLASTPGSWSALYVNGLRQDVSMYSISGTTLTLNVQAAQVGDAIIFDYI